MLSEDQAAAPGPENNWQSGKRAIRVGGVASKGGGGNDAQST